MTSPRVPSRLERGRPRDEYEWPLKRDERTGRVSLALSGNSPFYSDPQRGLNFRAGDGLVVSSASPFALRMTLAPGLRFDDEGQIAPVVSKTVKVIGGELTAVVAAADVEMATDETIADAIVDLRVNKVSLTSAGYVAALASIADHEARLDTIEAKPPQLDVAMNCAPAAGTTYTNMPLADGFFLSSARHVRKADLTNYTQARLLVNKQATAGASGAKLAVRYSATYSTTVSDYLALGAASAAIEVAVDVADTYLDSGWVSISRTAAADVFLALIGYGGDGAIDPTFGSISVQFR